MSAGLLQKIRAPLRMYDIQTCEDALKKAQCIETDDEGPSTSSAMEKRLEEKLENLQQY
jgi:hypothetical protein